MNWKEEWHHQSLKMARDTADGKLQYKDVEDAIVDWWMNKIKLSNQQLLNELEEGVDKISDGIGPKNNAQYHLREVKSLIQQKRNNLCTGYQQ